MAFKFNGEIGKDADGSFSVKIELVGLQAMSDAQEVGKFLHETVMQYVESRGARVLNAAEKPRIILQS